MEKDYIREIQNSLEEISRHLSLIGYRLDKLADKSLLSTENSKDLSIQLDDITDMVVDFNMDFEYATKEDKNERNFV